MNKEKMFLPAIMAAAVALAGCEPKAENLAKAEFDEGGNTFDLVKISSERFPIPEGGFTGYAERLKDSDPETIVALSVDWAKVRQTAKGKGGARGMRLRYRFRNIKEGSGTGRKWLTIRGIRTEKDGTRVLNQEDWRTKIQETGGQWADYYLPDVGMRTTSDRLELLLDVGDGFGILEIKDCSSVPFPTDPASNPAKYAIEIQQDGVSFFDNVFTLAKGAVQPMKFNWKLNDRKLKLDRKKLSLRMEAPPGVKVLNDNENIPHEMMPYPRWWAWYAPFFFVTTDLEPGTDVGECTVTAWYDGKPCSKPLKIKLAVAAPAIAKAVPKRYFNGICLVGPEGVYSSDANLEAYVKMMHDAGVRGYNGNRKFHDKFKKFGGILWDSSGAFNIANGFTIGTNPATWEKCPADQKFITIDKNGKLVPHKTAVCPSMVYLEKSYYRDYVVPYADRVLKGYYALMTNWEPNQFFGRGCFCTNCRAEFARFLGKSDADVAKDWPACARTGGRFFEQALKFRATQHGRLVKTIDKTMRRIMGKESGGFCPVLVWTEVSGDLLEDPLSPEVSADEYAGSLEWLNAWGPYVSWRADRPYFHEKRYCLAEWVSAKVVYNNVQTQFAPKPPKLISYPSGMQGNNLTATPDWLGLCMDSYFFNQWQGSLVYFMPRGYDVRWWQKFAEATTRAGLYEDYVLDGKRCDELTALSTVKEYAANCHQVSAYLRKERDISPLQSATYDLNGARIVATVNFWEEGAAFYRLSTKGLKSGKYTVVIDRETLLTKPDGTYLWTEKELAEGFFAGMGAARTKVFEIRPADGNAETGAKNRISVSDMEKAYERLQPSLRKESERDHEEEKYRSNLCPDGLLII